MKTLKITIIILAMFVLWLWHINSCSQKVVSMYDRTIISSVEIITFGEEYRLYDAWSLINTLRPNYLIHNPAVFYNGLYYSDLDGLETIRLKAIKYVKYYRPAEIPIQYIRQYSGRGIIWIEGP